MARNSFVMLDSWMNLFSNMSDEDAGQMIKAIASHRLGGESSIDNPVGEAVKAMICAEIDRMNEEYEQKIEKRREAGKKGGESKAKQSLAKLSNAKQEQTKASIAKHTESESDSESDTESVSVYDSESVTSNEVSIIKKPRREDVAEEIVSYLNQRAGTQYRPSSSKTRSLIRARLREGYSVDDFKDVIDKKTKEWIGTEREKYLRPETLFGTKFEGYLNQKIRRARDPIEERRSFFADILEG